jgi:hypothetical protein
MAREDARPAHQQVNSDQESSDRQGQDLGSFSSSGIRSDQPAFRGDGDILQNFKLTFCEFGMSHRFRQPRSNLGRK